MIDIALLAETARAIHAAGGLVRTLRIENRARFMAGDTMLNGQAVADLLNAGWLRASGPRDLFMDTLPPFAATNDPAADPAAEPACEFCGGSGS